MMMLIKPAKINKFNARPADSVKTYRYKDILLVAELAACLCNTACEKRNNENKNHSQPVSSSIIRLLSASIDLKCSVDTYFCIMYVHMYIIY